MKLALISDNIIQFLESNNFKIGDDKETSDVVLLNDESYKINNVNEIVNIVARQCKMRSKIIYSSARDADIVRAKKLISILVLHYFDCKALYDHFFDVSGFSRLNLKAHFDNEPWIYDNIFIDKLFDICSLLNIQDLMVKSYNNGSAGKVIVKIGIDELKRRI